MALALLKRDPYEQMVCGECGIDFYVPEHFYRERRKTGKSWHCPNGHGRVFLESELDELRSQLAAKECELVKARAGHRNSEAERAKLARKLKRVTI